MFITGNICKYPKIFWEKQFKAYDAVKIFILLLQFSSYAVAVHSLLKFEAVGIMSWSGVITCLERNK